MVGYWLFSYTSTATSRCRSVYWFTSVSTAMVASMVGLTTPITFASTGLVLQDVLNSILPNLLNLGIVMLMYTLIRKKVKTGWLLGICIVGGVAINALGLLV